MVEEIICHVFLGLTLISPIAQWFSLSRFRITTPGFWPSHFLRLSLKSHDTPLYH